MKKRAFTLAEAILTMTILGIIAATMVATLRPGQYKQQGLDVLKKKIYAELDGVIQTYIVECGKDLSALTIYDGCSRSSASTHAFGTVDKGDLSYLQSHYMKGTYAAKSTAQTGCDAVTDYESLKLRNGACIYFASKSVRVDVNGTEGPNATKEDRMALTIDASGIATDVDTAITNTGW